MTYKKAIRLLSPETMVEALAEAEYYGGFKGKEAAANEFCEALLVACEAMERQIPKKPEERKKFEGVLIGRCPICGMGTNLEENFCFRCGQAIDWKVENEL